MKTGKWLYIDRLINNLCPMRLRMKIYRAAGMEIGESVSLAYGIHFDNPAAVTIGHHTNVNKFTMFYTGDPLTAHITVGNYVAVRAWCWPWMPAGPGKEPIRALLSEITAGSAWVSRSCPESISDAAA